MQGAIITFSPTDTVFARFKSARRDIFALPFDDKTVFVYTIPYCEKTYLSLRENQKQKINLRITQQMEHDGVTCIYANRQLHFPANGNFFIPDGRRIFSAFAGQIIERHAVAASLSPDAAKIYICETPFSQRGVSAAKQLAMHTKQLTFISLDVEGMQRCADTMFSEYGLPVQCSEDESRLNKADIALLLTPPKIQVVSSGLVLDFTGTYPYPARRDLHFNTAVGYAPLLPYFDKQNCQSAEFILSCYGSESAPGLCAELHKIGWYEKA